MSAQFTPLNLFLAPALLLVSAAVVAQPRTAPIKIQADHAEYSKQAGTSTFSGAVVLSQAGLTLYGNRLTVTQNGSNGPTRAKLTGDPAHLNMHPDKPDAQPITGHAQTMLYNSATRELVLKGDAVINRAGNSIHSSIIRHNLDTGTTEAGNADGAEGGRVHIILQPDNTPAKNAAQNHASRTQPPGQSGSNTRVDKP